MAAGSTPTLPIEAHRGGAVRSLIAAARARCRRRRLLIVAAAAALAATGIALAARWMSAPTTVQTVPAARLFAAQQPFIGVACHTANSTRCGRIGIAVWLRHPADSVVVSLAGQHVQLKNGSLGGGKVVTYYGYAHLSTSALRLPVWWAGTPPRYLVLRVVARSGSAAAERTLRLQLHPGWG